MNSRGPPVRVLGQRSITSTLLFRTSTPNQSGVCKENAKVKVPNKGSGVSLSDFLNRKLHRSSVLPSSSQGKEENHFLSPVGHKDLSGSNERKNETKKRVEAEVKPVLDEVFEQFKWTRKVGEDCIGSCAIDDVGNAGIDDIQNQASRKRKSPFSGEDGKQSARKHLVVLGGDPQTTRPIAKRKEKKESLIANKKPKHPFNHYANGCGWWDCNMEGVDNEEVGCSEVWEGIGSATLGELEWN
ncbi:uncharacterized protein LOC127800321 [Diospyros lotus]|uniref:uncharacterized protein LOC127800321 n=1 Tax=Diospyros lotus TaxID=55363 RepID=UPI00225A6DA5|nr:uncharacterized protein LOC127800321 [Diospyros lotus]